MLLTRYAKAVAKYASEKPLIGGRITPEQFKALIGKIKSGGSRVNVTWPEMLPEAEPGAARRVKSSIVPTTEYSSAGIFNATRVGTIPRASAATLPSIKPIKHPKLPGPQPSLPQPPAPPVPTSNYPSADIFNFVKKSKRRRYAVIDPNQPTVNVSVPVPAPIQKKPKQPRQQPQPQPQQAPIVAPPRPVRQPRAFILPWTPGPRKKRRSR